MLKKMIVGLVAVATMGVLVVGGINRTVAKTADRFENNDGSLTGRLSRSDDPSDNHGLSSKGGRQAASPGDGRYLESDEIQNKNEAYQGGNGQGRRGNGREQAKLTGDPLNLAAEQFTELVELEGVISSVDLTEDILIETSDGQIILEGRSLSFAVEQGFTAQTGNNLLLEGFYEDTDFEIVQITNQTSGQVTTLREPTGRPLWAGGGRTW